jgi:hypothetical protein
MNRAKNIPVSRKEFHGINSIAEQHPASLLNENVFF